MVKCIAVFLKCGKNSRNMKEVQQLLRIVWCPVRYEINASPAAVIPNGHGYLTLVVSRHVGGKEISIMERKMAESNQM